MILPLIDFSISFPPFLSIFPFSLYHIFSPKFQNDISPPPPGKIKLNKLNTLYCSLQISRLVGFNASRLCLFIIIIDCCCFSNILSNGPCVGQEQGQKQNLLVHDEHGGGSVDVLADGGRQHGSLQDVVRRLGAHNLGAYLKKNNNTQVRCIV